MCRLGVWDRSRYRGRTGTWIVNATYFIIMEYVDIQL